MSDPLEETDRTLMIPDTYLRYRDRENFDVLKLFFDTFLPSSIKGSRSFSGQVECAKLKVARNEEEVNADPHRYRFEFKDVTSQKEGFLLKLLGLVQAAGFENTTSIDIKREPGSQLGSVTAIFKNSSANDGEKVRLAGSPLRFLLDHQEALEQVFAGRAKGRT